MKIKKSWVRKLRSSFYVAFFVCIAILFIVLFHSHLVKAIDAIWVNPIMLELTNHFYLRVIVCILFFLLTLLYYFFTFQYEREIHKTRFYSLMAYSIVYLICFFSNEWSYTSLWGDNRWLCYTHLTLFPFFIELIHIAYSKWNSFDLVNSYNPELELELPIKNIADDTYKRSEFIASVENTLRTCFFKKGAFAIGITGDWGSGKTSFLGLLKKDIEKNVDIVIEFNPWRSNSPNNIIQDFFKIYKSEVSLYAPSLSPTIVRYALILLKATEQDFIVARMAKDCFDKPLNNSNDINLQYNEIHDKLINLKLRTVVIIDDLDRLDRYEILEVLKLIRNTANFPYIQFIVAYDKDYTTKCINEFTASRADEYFEKIFDLEIALPKYERRVICEALHEKMKAIFENAENVDIEKIVYISTNTDIYHERSYFIPQVLKTKRDVIRFSNSLKLIVNAFKNNNLLTEINYKDLFLVELLRYKFPDIYNRLKDETKSILSPSQSNDYYMYTKNKNKDICFIAERILFELFTKNINDIEFSTIKNNNRIYQYSSFDKYFLYRFDQKRISYSEVLALLKANNPKQIVKQGNWGIYKYSKEFYTKIESLLLETIPKKSDEEGELDYKQVYPLVEKFFDFEDENIRNESIDAACDLIKDFHFVSSEQLNALLDMFDKILSAGRQVDGYMLEPFLYKKNEQGVSYTDMNYKDINDKSVKCFLENTENYRRMTELIEEFIFNYIDQAAQEDLVLVLSLEVLKEIQVTYLKKEIVLKSGIIDNDILKLLYCCKDGTKNSKGELILTPNALEVVKSTIEKQPQSYISLFLQVNYRSNQVEPELFFDQIFGDFSSFENFIFNHKNDHLEGITKVRNFIELYKWNGYSPVRYTDANEALLNIRDNFKAQKEQLDKLLGIRTYLIEREILIKGETEKGKMFMYVIKDTNERESFRYNVENNPLKIKLKDNLLETIRN